MRLKILIAFIFVSVAIITTFAFHLFNRSGISYSHGHRLLENRLPGEAIPYLERAVALQPNFKRALRDLGNASVWTGNFSRAAECFDRLIKIDPANRYARRGMADIKSWNGQRREAIDLYRQLLSERPGELDTVRTLAEALFWEKDYASAISLYRMYLKSDPFQQESLIHLAQALASTGRADEAEEIFAELERMFPVYPPVLKAIAAYKLSNEDCAAAIAYYDRVLRISPYDIEALSRESECLSAQGKWSSAIELICSASDDAKSDIPLKIACANVLLWGNEYSDASARFSAILENAPDDAGALAGLAHSCAWQGNFQCALPHLERLHSIDPANAAAARELAEAYLALGKSKEAELLYEGVLGGSAPIPASSTDAAHGRHLTVKAEQSAKLGRSALDRDPNSKAALSATADAAIRQKRFDDAEIHLRRMLERSPSSSMLHEKLGDVLSWQGKLAEAEEQYKIAESQAPKKGRGKR